MIVGVRDDYWEHLLFFAVSGILVVLAYLKRFRIVYLIIFALAYAAICELIQWAIPYRTFNPIDLALNIGGILTGILAGWLIDVKYHLSQYIS